MPSSSSTLIPPRVKSAPRPATPTRLEERAKSERLFAELASDPQNKDVRDELCVLYLKLARYLASKFCGRGEPIDDLVQVASIGLMKAIQRFDTSRGNSFTSYATPTIVGELRRYFRDLAPVIRTPRRLQALRLRILSAREAWTCRTGRLPTVKNLAGALDESEEDVIEALELTGNCIQPFSLDSLWNRADNSNQAQLSESLGAVDPAMARVEDACVVEKAMSVLDDRQRLVIRLRFFQEMAQSPIATKLHVSQMQISRIERQAVARMHASCAATA